MLRTDSLNRRIYCGVVPPMSAKPVFLQLQPLILHILPLLHRVVLQSEPFLLLSLRGPFLDVVPLHSYVR